MAGRLEGKVAIVTGRTSGMGLATVRRFLAEGARVVVADLNQANGDAALVTCADDGHADGVRFCRVDVSSEADIERLVAFAVVEFGQLDIMFNNAGVGGAFGALTDLDVDDWDYTFAVLVRGVFLGIKHAARQMVAQGWGGSIINTGSIAGLSGGAGPMAYSTAKAAVNHLAHTCAPELSLHGIRVNTILPGPIKTPLMLGRHPDDTVARMAQFVPNGVLGEPEHIASVALFYASDDSAYVTGDGTVVDGGLTAAAPGIVMRHALDEPPPGVTGTNRGTTGERTTVRTANTKPS